MTGRMVGHGSATKKPVLTRESVKVRPCKYPLVAQPSSYAARTGGVARLHDVSAAQAR